ncbi:MAG: DUF3786 domain-containing protein [Anaerolineae bacterium]
MKDSRNYLAEKVEELRLELQKRDTAVLAANTRTIFKPTNPGQGYFELTVWGETAVLTWPDFVGRDAETGDPMPVMMQAMLAYYFHTADGTPPAGEWMAFGQLPDGQFYTAAFQGYTGNELVKVFGNDVDEFRETAVALGGQFAPMGDAAFTFSVFPGVSLMVVCWQGDEDFSPSYRLLFDANASHQLPTDACAILGSTLTRRLVKLA